MAYSFYATRMGPPYWGSVVATCLCSLMHITSQPSLDMPFYATLMNPPYGGSAVSMCVFVHEIHITAQPGSDILTFVYVVSTIGHPRSVVANPDRGRYNRENGFSLCPLAPDILVSRVRFSCPFRASPSIFSTQAKSSAYLRGSIPSYPFPLRCLSEPIGAIGVLLGTALVEELSKTIASHGPPTPRASNLLNPQRLIAPHPLAQANRLNGAPQATTGRPNLSPSLASPEPYHPP